MDARELKLFSNYMTPQQEAEEATSITMTTAKPPTCDDSIQEPSEYRWSLICSPGHQLLSAEDQ